MAPVGTHSTVCSLDTAVLELAPAIAAKFTISSHSGNRCCGPNSVASRHSRRCHGHLCDSQSKYRHMDHIRSGRDFPDVYPLVWLLTADVATVAATTIHVVLVDNAILTTTPAIPRILTALTHQAASLHLPQQPSPIHQRHRHQQFLPFMANPHHQGGTCSRRSGRSYCKGHSHSHSLLH